ncbi:MAG: response regulator [Planctomycetaceae bacterium]|nr:response regulator [Planctomycetaceae bacterium]
MSLGLEDRRSRGGAVRCGTLPRRMRVLFVTSEHRTGGWLAEALATDSAVTVELHEALGTGAGVERLRDERYDAVLVTHESEQLDAFEFVEALRAGGADEPVIILGSQPEPELGPVAFEVGADAYLCANTATTRLLLWKLARAWEHHALIHENRRLALAEKQRLQTEHHEAQKLLDEQRALIRDLEALPGSTAHDERPVLDSSPSLTLPPELIGHYRELLRAYVMMGQGNLGTQMAALAELLAGANASTSEVMQLHLRVVEELVRGLGSRSARHVLARADLLILEVMVHLGECYRQR